MYVNVVCILCICQDGVDSFTCVCNDGYTGIICETEIDECETDPCYNDGTCVVGIIILYA